jgi:hypothetical protein
LSLEMEMLGLYPDARDPARDAELKVDSAERRDCD